MSERKLANHVKGPLKIGFYGGTFNPIHFGHLNLAIEMMEIHGLDQVWFCPAYINPHRQNESPISVHHRINMIELAISELSQFQLISTESVRERPSYTIDTLRELIALEKKKGTQVQFFLILGADAVKGFFQWKQPEKIVELVPLLVGSRDTRTLSEELLFSGEVTPGQLLVAEAIKRGMTPTRYLQISSTEIRERVGKGLYCKHLVPTKVMDYIYENHLYSSL